MKFMFGLVDMHSLHTFHFLVIPVFFFNGISFISLFSVVLTDCVRTTEHKETKENPFAEQKTGFSESRSVFLWQ